MSGLTDDEISAAIATLIDYLDTRFTDIDISTHRIPDGGVCVDVSMTLGRTHGKASV